MKEGLFNSPVKEAVEKGAMARLNQQLNELRERGYLSPPLYRRSQWLREYQRQLYEFFFEAQKDIDNIPEVEKVPEKPFMLGDATFVLEDTKWHQIMTPKVLIERKLPMTFWINGKPFDIPVWQAKETLDHYYRVEFFPDPNSWEMIEEGDLEESLGAWGCTGVVILGSRQIDVQYSRQNNGYSKSFIRGIGEAKEAT